MGDDRCCAWRCLLLGMGLLVPVARVPAQAEGGTPVDADLPTATAPADEATPEERLLLRMVGDNAVLLRTSHFVVAHNSQANVVNELVHRLEITYHSANRFCASMGVPAAQAEDPLEVLFFDQHQAYVRYCMSIGFAARGTYGVYFEPANRSAFYNVATDASVRQLGAGIVAAQRGINELEKLSNQAILSNAPVRVTWGDGSQELMTASQLRRRARDARSELKDLEKQRRYFIDNINRTVVQHEIAHQMLFNAGLHARGAQNPKWLVEGLACLFETPPTSTGIGIGTVNQMRLSDLRETIGGEVKGRLRTDHLITAINEGRLIDPVRLVSDSDSFEVGGPSAQDCYALSWALAHYLSQVRREELGTYLRELRTRSAAQRFTDSEELALFEKHFGALDEAWLRRFGNYILRIPVRRTGG